MKRLKDKIAVVTGGSKGIGKAVALALAKEGCDVVISARESEELRKVAHEISKWEVRSLAVPADVRKPSEVAALRKKVESKFGAPHILVNNAGIGRFAEVINFRDEDFRATIETNLLGPFYCSREFLPGMIRNGGGHIINMASLAGKNSFNTGSAYCASKHALISFSECMMLEVRHHNIKVTAICPGTVQTNFGALNSKEKAWALTSEDVSKAVVDVLLSSPGSLASLIELRPLRPPQKR